MYQGGAPRPGGALSGDSSIDERRLLPVKSREGEKKKEAQDALFSGSELEV